jgi:O-acetyl-ADP-ribose deacetylase (regulator of RNase III)
LVATKNWHGNNYLHSGEDEQVTHDNIFESDCDAIVNTINCVGNMGGGLAKAFRERFPDMNEAYQHACANDKVRVGQMWTWWQKPWDWRPQGQWIINFPTKADWRNPSQLQYIADGLVDLKGVIHDLHLTSIAIPALGCGLGGLDWEEVEPLLIDLAGQTPAALHIYPPEGKFYTI